MSTLNHQDNSTRHSHYIKHFIRIVHSSFISVQGHIEYAEIYKENVIHTFLCCRPSLSTTIQFKNNLPDRTSLGMNSTRSTP